MTEFFDGKQTDETMLIERYFNEDYFDSYRKNKNIIYLSFDKRLDFQNYIDLKYKVNKFTNEMTEISSDEFIY